jgi:hypothetical protein
VRRKGGRVIANEDSVFLPAVITKEADGNLRVNKDETSTRGGAWGGLGVGALDREETERQIADLMSGQG